MPETQPGTGSLLERASKVVDLRNAVRPPTFDSRPERWSEFKFKLKAVLSLIGLEETLDRCCEVPDEGLALEALEERSRQGSQLLYALLVSSVTGRAQSMMRLVPAGAGYQAWK